MSRRKRRIRPGRRTEADQSVHGQANTSIVSADARLVSLLDGVYVLVVALDPDHARRRTYFNLPSAQRAADRARERGREATIALCELRPLGVVS